YFTIDKDSSKTLEEIYAQPFRRNPRSKKGYIVLSDEAFNGQTYSGKHILNQIFPGDSLVFSFANISEGYYKFLKAGPSGSQDILTTSLSEPFNYPTNIEGGYGFFNVCNPHVFVKHVDVD
ncbi:MAG TPA: DUF4249 family protein, partial [Cytophagaceae bacterium]